MFKIEIKFYHLVGLLKFFLNNLHLIIKVTCTKFTSPKITITRMYQLLLVFFYLSLSMSLFNETKSIYLLADTNCAQVSYLYSFNLSLSFFFFFSF